MKDMLKLKEVKNFDKKTGIKTILLMNNCLFERIKWETIETEWLERDAPREIEEEEPFNPEEYRSLMNKRLSKKQDPNKLRYEF